MVMKVSALKPRVRQNIGLIRAGVGNNLTSGQINSLISKAQGVGIRRRELLAGIRYVKGIREAGAMVQNTRKTYRPDPARIPIAKTSIRNRYSFTVELQGINPITGVSQSTYLQVRSDTLLTPAQIEEQALDAVAEALRGNPSDLPFEVLTVIVREALKRG